MHAHIGHLLLLIKIFQALIGPDGCLSAYWASHPSWAALIVGNRSHSSLPFAQLQTSGSDEDLGQAWFVFGCTEARSLS